MKQLEFRENLTLFIFAQQTSYIPISYACVNCSIESFTRLRQISYSIMKHPFKDCTTFKCKLYTTCIIITPQTY